MYYIWACVFCNLVLSQDSEANQTSVAIIARSAEKHQRSLCLSTILVALHSFLITILPDQILRDRKTTVQNNIDGLGYVNGHVSVIDEFRMQVLALLYGDAVMLPLMVEMLRGSVCVVTLPLWETKSSRTYIK